MKKRNIILVLGLLIIVIAGVYWYYHRQNQTLNTAMKKPVIIGIVKYIPLLDPIEAGFKKQMAAMGYVEGKDVIYIDETTNGNPDLSKLNAEVKDEIAKGAQILYTFPVESSLAALQETKAENRTDIPIVAAATNAPIEWGLIKSFQSSGNNVTGIAIELSNSVQKQLDFLRRILPNAKTLAVINSKQSNLTGQLTYQEVVKQAPNFGFTVKPIILTTPPGPQLVQGVTQELSVYKPGDFDAGIIIPNGPYSNLGSVFVNLENQVKAPVTVFSLPQVQQGGLFSYTYDFGAAGVQSASFVDKIIKGQKPSDIPFEYTQKNVLYLNLKTAQNLGITVPDSIVSIADKVFR